MENKMKKMYVIYEPKGKAREYSELACNLFNGCSHACKYCYCPAIRYKKLEEWASNPKPRKDILEKLEKDAKKIQGEERSLLFSFMTDPYHSEEAAEYTRQALLICEKYKFKNVHVLTKGGMKASKDFDILKRNGWWFASTIIFDNDKHRKKWEPNAESIENRYKAVQKANDMNIKTWISIEPVIIPEESLIVIEKLKDIATKWKIGKLNHNKKLEKTIDWEKFYNNAKQKLKGKPVYWKKDLLEAVNQKRSLK